MKKAVISQINQRKVIAMILTAVILASIAYLGISQRFMQNQLDAYSAQRMSTLILQAVDNLQQPLPRDAKTGEYYMPDVRMRLPATSESSKRLEYSYVPKTGDIDEELRVSSFSATLAPRTHVMNAQNMNALFDAVPKLQACTRGFKLTFGQLDGKSQEGLVFVHEKTLQDGRRLFIYAEADCNAEAGSALEYLKQIDSY